MWIWGFYSYEWANFIYQPAEIGWEQKTWKKWRLCQTFTQSKELHSSESPSWNSNIITLDSSIIIEGKRFESEPEAGAWKLVLRIMKIFLEIRNINLWNNHLIKKIWEFLSWEYLHLHRMESRNARRRPEWARRLDDFAVLLGSWRDAYLEYKNIAGWVVDVSLGSCI